MENMLGLLGLCVGCGINLAVRDARTSDPYVVIKMGDHELKTSVIKNNINPEWNEKLTLSVADPDLPVKLTIYDKDTFSHDDKMGDAEFSIRPLFDVAKMHLEDFPNGSVIKRVPPSNQNCLAKESCITWADGKVVQDISLRLRNVECGEIELQLLWIDLQDSKGL